MNAANLNQHLTNAYSSLQQKFNEGRDRDIKEIHAFQKYFETVYDPDDLSRMIREAVATLK